MPKAILEFALPEESYEHQSAVAACDLRRAIMNFDQWLRNMAKHESKSVVSIAEAKEMLREETAGASFILE